jgi:hypothetical protein
MHALAAQLRAIGDHGYALAENALRIAENGPSDSGDAPRGAARPALAERRHGRLGVGSNSDLRSLSARTLPLWADRESQSFHPPREPAARAQQLDPAVLRPRNIRIRHAARALGRSDEKCAILWG